MKSNLLFYLFLIINSGSFIYSQTVLNVDDLLTKTMYEIDKNMRLNDGKSNVDLSKVTGSPYERDSFVPGKVFNKELNDFKPYLLRYNIYNDAIELKKNNYAVEIIKSSSIYAIINDTEYYYLSFLSKAEKKKEGYFSLLYTGSDFKIFIRKTKKYEKEVKAETPYHSDKPAIFLDSESYYLEKDNTLLLIPKKKKDFLQQYPKYGSELKKYMKAEKISLNSEEDITKLFTYIDSLLE